MILAAGLGTRLRPLSALCAKPAMPVRNVPVIAYTLMLLSRHGVKEVVINTHYLPDTVRTAVERHCPSNLTVRFSHEEQLLGTGGGMKAVANFLRESDPSIIVAGDMLLDVDLTAAVARHRERGDQYTLLLREDDPRAADFGTIGVDDERRVRRVGERFDLGDSTQAALFTGVRIAATRALSGFPPEAAFEDLTDWLGPKLRSGVGDIRGDCVPFDACTWEPVGTPREYLDVNLAPPNLSYDAEIADTPDSPTDVVIGAGATVHANAELHRAVVWAGEHVPADTRASDGVFAGGRFHPCPLERRQIPQPQDGKLAAERSPGRSS
jgi:mannose-1-phosphate guanylyltransferase